MRTAAFFDLDGTLLTVNSARLWVERERRAGLVGRRGLVRAAGFLLAYRLGVVNIERAFAAPADRLKGADEAFIEAEVARWWVDEVARHVAPQARAAVEAHRRRDELLVLLTASTLPVAQAAQREFGLHVALGTRYESVNGRLTGKVVHPICFGVGKVELALELARQEGIDLARSSFYSDSYTDLPMLESVGHPYVVNPDLRLGRTARRRGWPVLDWRRSL